MIALEPGQLKPFVLKRHRDMDAPVTYQFRALSARAILKPKAVLNKLIDVGDVETEEQLTELCDAIRLSFVGRVDGQNVAELEDAFEMNDLFEFIAFVASGGVTYEDKKKLESPASSEPDCCVNHAVPASAAK